MFWKLPKRLVWFVSLILEYQVIVQIWPVFKTWKWDFFKSEFQSVWWSLGTQFCRAVEASSSVALSILYPPRSLWVLYPSLFEDFNNKGFNLVSSFLIPKRLKAKSRRGGRGENQEQVHHFDLWLLSGKIPVLPLLLFPRPPVLSSRPIVHKTTSYPFLPCCSLFFHFSTWHLLNEFPWNPFFCCESLLPYRTAIFWWNILLLKLREKEVGSQAE